MTAVFREMLELPGIIHAPIAYDPLSAKIAERVGFRALDIGGYALGASSCVPEPLLSLEEVAMATRRMTAAVHIEDQVFPKRVHYHKGQEHVIPAEEMCEKIRHAAKCRRDSGFVIAA